MKKIRKIRNKSLGSRYLTFWQNLSGWRLFLFYAMHYTMLFMLICPWIFASYKEAGKTLIWNADATSQWCTYLVYISRTIRNGIQSLLAGEGWSIPMYDFTFGPMEYDLRLEPIQFIAALWPWDRIDILYVALVIVRYYLIGLSFSVFGFYFKQKPLPILIGAVSYTFCGFTLFAGVRHPFYMAAVIYLPLLVVGAEKVIRKEKPWLLTCLVFLALFTNFYFACMLAVATVIFILVRFFSVYHDKRWQEFRGLVGRLTVSVGLGVALSAVVMIPSLLQNLGTGRIGRDRLAYLDLVKYSKDYYSKYISYFIINSKQVGSWLYLGFSVLVMPAILCLFIQRKEETSTLRRIFVILTGMCLLPSVAYVMSGFDTVSNRWCFIYAFSVCAILMFELPCLIDADTRTFAYIAIGATVYFLVCYCVIDHDSYQESAIALLTGAMLLLTAGRSCGNRKTVLWISCLGITCLSVCYSAYLLYDTEQGNYVNSFLSDGTFYGLYERSPYASFARSDAKDNDGSFYRVGSNEIYRSESNIPFYYDVNGITGHNSYYYQSYWDWNKDLELSQHYVFGLFMGVDGRAGMLSLDNIKYYVMRETGAEFAPYGFHEIERIKNDTNTDVILENEYALPLGYTYDSYMLADQYEELGGIEKQEAQLQAVLLDEAPSLSGVGQADIITAARQIPATISEMKDLTWDDGKLVVKKNGATATLTFEGMPDSETYLRMVNLDLTDGYSTRQLTLSAATETTVAKAAFQADAHVYATGMKTQLLNLGYSEDGYTTCTITFPAKGTYILDDMQIWCQPMEHYGEQIDSLREEPLENIQTNWRGLTGTISLSRDKILCLSIPYSDGWTAYVDGKKTDILQANTAFMGIELSAGDHVIELKYWTPGLTAGIIVSLIGLVWLVGTVLYFRKKGNGADVPMQRGGHR